MNDHFWLDFFDWLLDPSLTTPSIQKRHRCNSRMRRKADRNAIDYLLSGGETLNDYKKETAMETNEILPILKEYRREILFKIDSHHTGTKYLLEYLLRGIAVLMALFALIADVFFDSMEGFFVNLKLINNIYIIIVLISLFGLYFLNSIDKAQKVEIARLKYQLNYVNELIENLEKQMIKLKRPIVHRWKRNRTAKRTQKF